MNLGISTSCFYPLETEVSLETIGKNGVKTAEIFFNAQSELKNSFVDMLCDIKEEYGITISSIHPTMSLAESFVFFSNYERRFYEGLESYRRYSEIAATLGAKYIILHGGKPNGILSDEEYCERYMQIKEATKQNGITVLQENVFKHRAGDIEFLRSIKNILGHDAEFCFDVKQAIRCGYDPLETIKELSSNIKHYHISDHSVASDCLLPLNGNFNFEELFKYLKSINYNDSLITEVYNNAYKNYTEIFNSFEKLKKIKE